MALAAIPVPNATISRGRPGRTLLDRTVGRDSVEGMLVKMDPRIGIATVRIAGRALELSC